MFAASAAAAIWCHHSACLLLLSCCCFVGRLELTVDQSWPATVLASLGQLQRLRQLQVRSLRGHAVCTVLLRLHCVGAGFPCTIQLVRLTSCAFQPTGTMSPLLHHAREMRLACCSALPALGQKLFLLISILTARARIVHCCVASRGGNSTTGYACWYWLHQIASAG